MSLSANTAHRIVLCTCPDTASAERIAEALVAEKLAACVNIVPGLTSMYIWKGDTVRDSESLLLIKTRLDVLVPLQEAVQRLHPYELPEFVSVSIAEGSTAYLNWIDQTLEQ